MEQWTLTPSQASPEAKSGQGTSCRPDHENEVEKAKRHEAFKKKLLTHDGRFSPRPEALGAPTLDDEDEDMADDFVEGDASSGAESDPGFKKVMSMFSHSGTSSATAQSKGKSKQKASIKTKPTAQDSNKQPASATTGRKSMKPPPTIGPSGAAYTPLEMQVRPGSSILFHVIY
jgi:DNA mismatch repair protein MSH3